MAKHIETGKTGERLATEFLESIGYTIVEQNWRYSRAEIDIIAMDGETLVFVEVKTRSSAYFGPPEDFVDDKKQQLITAAANAYMIKHDYQWAIRFDIVSVLIPQNGTPRVEHFIDAFFSGL